MADASKYDILINDLVSIEGQVELFKEKNNGLLKRISDLEIQISEIRKENLALLQQLKKAETEMKKNPSSGQFEFDEAEKEKLKAKIQNLVNKIDIHLSAERQM